MTETQQTTGFVQVDGGALAYDVAGSGPAIVFIHAGVANRTMWDNQMAFFAPEHLVVRYDTRGFGQSTTESVEFSNRKDLIAVLDHLKIDRAVLVGNSRGGSIALDTSLEFPERVAGVVMLGSVHSGFEFDQEPDEEAKAMFEHLETLEKNKAWSELADLETHYWVNGLNQSPTRVDASIRDYVHSMILNNYTTQTVETTPQPLDPPAAQRLEQITCPLLVIIGALDEEYCVAGSHALADAVPHAQKIVYDNVAHMISLEQPSRFNDDVAQFLAGIQW